MEDKIVPAAEAYEADALPRKVDVHTEEAEGDAGVPELLTKKPVKQKSAAEWAYERLILYIQNFEKQLDNEHEIAMGMVGGETGALRIEGMGFFDPDIVTFYGSDPSGAKTQLIQHVSQLSVTLRALPKAVPMAEPRRIGFKLGKDLGSA
jgi:hypothetical protein